MTRYFQQTSVRTLRRWYVRFLVVVLVGISVLSRVGDLIALLVFADYPPERTIAFMAINSALFSIGVGAYVWHLWGRI